MTKIKAVSRLAGSLELTAPIDNLKGVGPRLAEKLKQLNLHTIRDLLFHLPIRYEDRTCKIPINQLSAQQSAIVEGVIVKARSVFGPRRSFICVIDDGSAQLQLHFYYFHAGLLQQLSQEGMKVRCFGTVRLSGGKKVMAHPEWQILPVVGDIPLDDRLTPIYSTTSGVSQSLLRKLIAQALPLLRVHTLEVLPKILLDQVGLLHLDQAIAFAHHPLPQQTVDLQRLAFEELLVHTLRLRKMRMQWQQDRSIQFPISRQLVPKLLQSLPFELTQAQLRVFNEIEHDLAEDCPMMRLVQGDVGSGKTIVALLAALSVIEGGAQVVLMAPTEILSKQHYQNFQSLCKPLSIQCALLTGSTSPKARNTLLTELASGDCQLLIGTHALFQDKIQFQCLSLVIIDEQHRFGVAQRAALIDKGCVAGFKPHQLVMTATPIPRTLAMTAYADLDCSVIDELPKGRAPISTVAIEQSRRADVIDRVKQTCAAGAQVYWVCTLIEESESSSITPALVVIAELQQALAPHRVDLIHGKMKAEQKERVMQQFKSHQLDVLVATTVIEVGVDVPNASFMVIENPERLGLSALHQLRGRVGRGALSSVCVLLYQSGLTPSAKERIDILRKTNDGFEIAKKDMELRGPGEILGVRQSGMISFKFADLIRDQELIPKVHKIVTQLLSSFPDLTTLLLDRWDDSK